MSGEVTVTCDCGAPMTERTNGQNGSTFMGCTRYPDCKKTQGLPAYLALKRAGALELPGLDPGSED